MGDNKIGLILLSSGVVFIVIGVISGINQGMVAGEMIGGMMHHQGNSFHFPTFLSSTGIGIFAGLVLIGLAEIIQNLPKQQKLVANQVAPPEPRRLERGAGELGEIEKEKVKKLFGNQVKAIHSTPYDSLCIVVLEQEVASMIKVLDVGGFTAKEVKDKEMIAQVMEWYQLHIK